MLKDLQILSLEKNTSNSVQGMKRMAIGLSQSISQSEMNYLVDKWKVYVLDDAQDDMQAHEGCIDEYWPRLLQAKTLSGDKKYSDAQSGEKRLGQ